jgi:crossover junction endodeoxyribonuclease RuvC
MNYTLGVDPGLTGAVAVFCENAFMRVFDMPVVPVTRNGRHKHEFNPYALKIELYRLGAGGAVIRAWQELVNAMPAQGVTSSFTFGWTAGGIYTALACAGASVQFVQPAAWKRFFGLKSGAAKDESVRLATQLYPTAAEFLTLKKHDGRAEAILIGRYGLIHA